MNIVGGYSLIDHFVTSSNLIHSVIGYKSLEIVDINHLPIKLEVTGHLGVSAPHNTVGHNRNTFIKKPKWLTATVQDINLYKQRVNTYLSELELPENIVSCRDFSAVKKLKT